MVEYYDAARGGNDEPVLPSHATPLDQLPGIPPPPMEPTIIFHHSNDTKYVAFAKIGALDGRFIDFGITPEMAHIMQSELLYHVRRHHQRHWNPISPISPPEGTITK